MLKLKKADSNSNSINLISLNTRIFHFLNFSVIMKRIPWVFFISSLFLNISLAQTTISGVINNYAKVSVIDTLCQSKLTVDDTTGFQVGMKVILIQMKGATIDENQFYVIWKFD